LETFIDNSLLLFETNLYNANGGLSNYHDVSTPSLPNYLALISGQIGDVEVIMAARIRIHALATYGTLLTLTWSNFDLAQLLGKVTWKECQVQTSAVAGFR